MAKEKDHTGKKFGRLTVMYRDSADYGKHVKWICECECGTTKSYYASNLTGGKSQSCGCKTSETVEKIRIGATKHGLSRTRAYKAWMSMKGRCLNPNYPNFHNYGGRGIRVCERWMSFDAFFEDMGECMSGLSLDRKENDGNYEPGNCRWTDNSTQQNNKRNTRKISAFGKTQTLSEWSIEVGLDPDFIRNRLSRGWGVEEALSIPKLQYKLK